MEAKLRKLLLAVFIVFGSLLIATCFNPLEDEDGMASFSINLGSGNAGRAAVYYPPNEDPDAMAQLLFKAIFVPVGEGSAREFSSKGNDSVSGMIASGTYNVFMDINLLSNGSPFAKGEAVSNPVTINSGSDNIIDIEVEQLKFTIIFDLNEGTGATPLPILDIPASNDTAYYGRYLPEGTEFSRDSLFFGGWNTQKDGSGITYPAGVSITPTGDITLYAVWAETPTLTYYISASAITSFGTLQIPYTQPAAQTVTVTNTGTGDVTLTQPTATNYGIGTLSATNLNAGQTATFTVQPKAGLAAETYNETITVSGSGGASAAVSASFTVTAATAYSISASALSSFGSLQTPYTRPAAQTVTITNTGTGSVTLTQPTATNYAIGPLSRTAITAGQTATFTVRPNTGLAVGTYNETITVNGTNGTSAAVNAAFTVSATPTYSISASVINSFGTLQIPYTQPAAQTVTITNTGNSAVTLSAIGTVANYTIGVLSTTSLPVNGSTATFTVRPNAGLAAGTYNPTITIRGSGASSGATATVRPAFTVNPTPTYTISASPNSPPFGSLVFGYAQPTATTVTITNTGNSAITLSTIGTVTNYTVTALSTTSLPANGSTATFTVRPNAGLSVGTYNPTITIRGTGASSGATATVRPAFSVTQATGASVVMPTLSTRTETSITVNTPATLTPATGQGRQYGISTSATTAPAAWVTVTAATHNFTSLNPGATYYVWGRTIANTNYAQGPNVISAGIATLAPTYTISASPNNPSFGSLAFGYAQPTATTVTITNTGTGSVTLTALSTITGYTLTQGANWTTAFTSGQTRTFTVRPNAGLSVGTYNPTITIRGSGASSGATATVTPAFSVTQATGASVAAATLSTRTETSITVNTPATLTPATGQGRQYGISTSATTAPAAWVTVTATTHNFTSLNPSTTYYVWGRTIANTNYAQGPNVISAGIATLATTYAISASPSTMDFGTLPYGYTQPAARNVTITRTGTGDVTLTQPDGGLYWTVGTLSRTVLTAANPTATFTVSPNAGLAVYTSYQRVININGTGGALAQVTVDFGVAAVYTITYNYTGFPDAPANTTGVSHNGPTSYTTSSTPINLPTIVTATSGHRFLGWYTDNTFGERVTQIPANSTGNRAYYALWEWHMVFFNSTNPSYVSSSDFPASTYFYNGAANWLPSVDPRWLVSAWRKGVNGTLIGNGMWYGGPTRPTEPDLAPPFEDVFLWAVN